MGAKQFRHSVAAKVKAIQSQILVEDRFAFKNTSKKALLLPLLFQRALDLGCFTGDGIWQTLPHLLAEAVQIVRVLSNRCPCNILSKKPQGIAAQGMRLFTLPPMYLVACSRPSCTAIASRMCFRTFVSCGPMHSL